MRPERLREVTVVQSTRPRVLLADDYVGILTALKRLLGNSCEIVGLATDGQQWLEAAHRLRPDVIVVDVRLPDINGLQACREIRAAGLPSKIVVLTAADDPAIEKGAFEAGASAFVAKWRVADELLPAIERVCATERLVADAGSPGPNGA